MLAQADRLTGSNLIPSAKLQGIITDNLSRAITLEQQEAFQNKTPNGTIDHMQSQYDV